MSQEQIQYLTRLILWTNASIQRELKNARKPLVKYLIVLYLYKIK